MKNITIKIIALSLLAFIVGCAGRIVHMENDQGNKIDCKVSTTSAMLTGVLVRDSAIDDCIKQHEAAGYKVTGEKK